ncbi:MAG: phosphoenolpyruvate--protein phosphotransferase [Kangiellaceae bacterium]
MIRNLARITKAVELADNQQQVLDLIVTNTCEELSVEVCSIFLADYATNQFVLMATKGLNSQSIGKVRINFNDGLVGLVGQREEPIHLQVADKHPSFRHIEGLHEEAFSAYLGVPIIHQRKVLGVLCIQQRDERQFEIDEETFLITLAAQISSTLSGNKTNALLSDDNSEQLVRCINGSPASNGVAIGVAKVIFPSHDIRSVPIRKTQDVRGELRRLQQAVKRTHVELKKMSERMIGLVSEQERSLFDAYQQILGSAGIEQEVESEIKSNYWAPSALKTVIMRHLKAFESMEDPYLSERGKDVEDLANRVLANMLRKPKQKANGTQFDNPVILVAETITAAMLAELETSKILAVVSLNGSTTSHAAIFTKALNIPAIMGLEPCQVNRLDEKQIIVDGYKGQLFVSPNTSLIERYETLIEEDKLLTKDLENETPSPAATKDGTPISLLINTSGQFFSDIKPSKINSIKSEQDSRSSQLLDKHPTIEADGIGLYRTEIPFMQHNQFPSEDEQVEIYQEALQRYSNRAVTIRTLDIGGDKSLPYFKIEEENPFLGWRGIRVTLDHPEIFLVQVRAMLRASLDTNNLKIALPMVATIEELDDSLRLLHQATAEIEEEAFEIGKTLQKPKVGIILEVPSAVLQLESIIARVDFLSIGTNDLIQYILAVDRNNQRIKGLYNHFQPAVLKVLKLIINECKNHDMSLQICGEMASDPLATILLIGMGYREFSMSEPNIARVKKTISQFTLDEMREISKRLNQYETATKIKSELLIAMENKGLGALIRAGN